MGNKHYTQQISELCASSDASGARATVRAEGFVTQEMVDDVLDGLRHSGPMPQQLLLDLREAAGYERGCAQTAGAFVEGAHREGVKQIACVASSSVLRTAATLVTCHSPVAVRVFTDQDAAQSWLGVPANRR